MVRTFLEKIVIISNCEQKQQQQQQENANEILKSLRNLDSSHFKAFKSFFNIIILPWTDFSQLIKKIKQPK